MGRSQKVKLPQNLVDAVREQRAVLFLGSGASLGSRNASGNVMPGAKSLTKALSDTFLSSRSAKEDLMVAAELAMSEAGTSKVNQWILELFESFEPTDAHLKLPWFRWKALATTNYDLLVEKAYDQSADGAQALVVRYKDPQPFGSMMDAQTHPLPFLKLHGCARHAHDAEVPLVLTPTSYNNHEANRTHLYGQLEGWAAEYTVIYCGQSLSDLHIRRLSQEGNRSARPFHFLVSPDLDDVKTRFWAEYRIEGVQATFSDLMNALEAALPPLMRLPRPAAVREDRPYQTFFTVNQDESDRLAAAFKTDLQLVHSGLPVGNAKAQRPRPGRASPSCEGRQALESPSRYVVPLGSWGCPSGSS